MAITRSRRVRSAARVVLGGALIIAGLGHLTFARNEFQAQVPDWVGIDKNLVVILSGLVEIALGLALIVVRRHRSLLGLGAGLFFIAVFPGNISQFIDGHDAFGLNSDAARRNRLFFQPVLVAWAWWSTNAFAVLRRTTGRSTCTSARQREAAESAVEVRTLDRTEMSRVVEIDRTERIDVLYEQHGTQLVARHGNWSASAWDPDGHDGHSVEAQVRTLEHHLDTGGIALGAFASGQLVGIGVVVPHLRPKIAQLAFLHVSARLRATGIGSRLSEQLEQIARTAGDSEMVVSATPSENTVRFYLGRGFEPMTEPLAELFELEPEDVHMGKTL